MKNIAVLDNNNVIVAINLHDDDYEVKENEIDINEPAFVGGDYVDGYLYAPQPFPSWTRMNGEWIPPIPEPTDLGHWSWNEEAQEWQD